MSNLVESNAVAAEVPPVATSETVREHDVMVPRGAVAFFVAMLVAFGVIWLGMYEILVVRQNGL